MEEGDSSMTINIFNIIFVMFVLWYSTIAGVQCNKFLLGCELALRRRGRWTTKEKVVCAIQGVIWGTFWPISLPLGYWYLGYMIKKKEKEMEMLLTIGPIPPENSPW
jgi:hypothetical protein